MSEQNREIKRNDSNMMLTRVLLIFYIIIASNFTDNLVSKQLKTFVQENRFAQHLIGFIMMLSFVILIGGVTNIEKGILYAVIGYMWFIFTTKLDIQWNIIIIILLLFGFIYETKLSEKEMEILNDASLTENQKNIIINDQQKYKIYTVIAIIATTVIGTFLYTNKKVVQYGGSYDIITFLFE
jgi:hypothetical protein